MGDTETGGTGRAAMRQREFIGGAQSNYRVDASPPLMRLVITPEQVEFRARGLARLLSRGPWTIPRDTVRKVFAKRRRSVFAPLVWDVEIVTTDPAVWWTFLSPGRPDGLLTYMEECGYPVDWTPHDWAGLPVEGKP